MAIEKEGRSPRFFSYEAVGDALAALSDAAQDRKPVTGWTHNFYRYPARFSPKFAAAAIASFSRPGELVLDPYMGGGTVLVEGLVAGRKVVGNDLNSLATFIAKVKTTPLSTDEIGAVKQWAVGEVSKFTYHGHGEQSAAYTNPSKTRNLGMVRARFIKKVIAAALASIDSLHTSNAQDFARCVVLRVGQWALDGREKHTPLPEFRRKLTATAHEMLEALVSLFRHLKTVQGSATILNADASALHHLPLFRDEGTRASLVITSPPYPGVHVLYHRWQVDGRRETPAPYWIAGCNDGMGASYYNFGDRRKSAADNYFHKSLLTLKSIRRVIQDGGYVVQMVAFNRPEEQLRRYLENMSAAGFTGAPTLGI